MADLPYIEQIYLGIGGNKKEAYADLIGTTNANSATDVNLNYNSYSDKWIAVGYRRTANVEDAVRDVFLYAGEDPPNEVKIDGYKLSETKKNGKVVTVTKAAQIPYKLIKHNLKSGAEVFGETMHGMKNFDLEGDQRVIMYVDHASFNGTTPEYQIRPNAALSNAGYYSATSKFGVLTQTN